MFVERIADLAAGLAAAEAVFGEDAVLQLVRVLGSSMARLADAIVSAFLVNVEPAVRDQDPVGLGVARANAEAVTLMPTVNAALDILLRQHLMAARRSILGVATDAGNESRRMCVGFVDLVGWTVLTRRLSARELGSVLTEFEQVAADTVTSAGGRVVKLIGDEVLYTAADEDAVCTIALSLARTFAEHPVVPPVRAGVAAGDVLLRDGDVFGPAVNLAARATKVAAAGELVAPAAVAAAAGIGAEPLGQKPTPRLRRRRNCPGCQSSVGRHAAHSAGWPLANQHVQLWVHPRIGGGTRPSARDRLPHRLAIVRSTPGLDCCSSSEGGVWRDGRKTTASRAEGE